MTVLTYILALIVTLGVLVTVHEYGHYLVARLSGVRIVRFAVGMGKPIWSRVDARGIEWAVAAIPLGGYLRMLDERDRDYDAQYKPTDVSFNMLHPAWRIAIALAGPVANFILAVVVYWVLALGGATFAPPVLGPMDADSPVAQAGLPDHRQIVEIDGASTTQWQDITMALATRLGDTGEIEIGVRELGGTAVERYRVPIQRWHRGVDEPELLASLGIKPWFPAVAATVEPGSPAARAGFKPWDRLLEIDGVSVNDWTSFASEIVKHPNREISIVVQRGEVPMTLNATPGVGSDGVSGYLGVGRPVETQSFGPLEAAGEALAETGKTVGITLGLLRKMFTGDVSLKNLSGPVTIAKVAGDSARVGWRYYIGVLALLSISLGILNLLPIPILDGGHVIFASAEWLMGRPVSDRAQELGYQVGLFLVGGLMLLALYNDFARVLSGL